MDDLYKYTDTYICIWPWKDAPDYYRSLSPHGGDEDWVAEVPPSLIDRWYLYVPTSICDTSEHLLDSGFLILIGAHA